MTITDLLTAGIKISGYVQIRCWEKREGNITLKEGFFDKLYKKYHRTELFNRDIVEIYPAMSFKGLYDEFIVIEVAPFAGSSA